MAPFQMPAEPQGRLATRLLLVALIIYGLYVGRGILAPLALALLLTVAALPVVDWGQRRGLPRVPVVIGVLLAAIGTIGGVLWLVLAQALQLAEQMPRYETELRRKLSSLSGTGASLFDNLNGMAHRLGQSVAPASAPAAQTVVIAQPPAEPFSAMIEVAGFVLAPAAMVAVTLLLMAFLLIQREDVRDRVLRLIGTDEIHRTTRAMQDATDRIGRFLLMQLLVNAVFGLAMGLGLWVIGVPNAPLWGVLAFVLRFVPYLGAPLAALFPILVALATTQGWTTVILVAAWFVVVDLVASYVAEPMLYGNSAGITPLALILSSIFWASLWGPIGLILAPAITACLAILGRHGRGLEFLDVVLGDSQALSGPERFYQRLLAGDASGAARLLAVAAEAGNEAAALRLLVEPAVIRLAADRPSEDFGARLALRSARTLMRALTDGDTPHSGVQDVQLVAAGGALDRAGAAMAALAL
ncbi:MAG: AI-2E family transporter, partial [Rubritepida sp.]|nr:AI-2E family transporter [Rubritepida sp.]